MDDSHIKTSFEPLDCPCVEVLVLGSMPGDRSIELQQYYAHPQNRFWRVIAQITDSELQYSYQDRKRVLRDNGIALWDVVHHASRPGSMDSAIRSEVPNDILGFIKSHKNLHTVAFNGRKAEQLYDKFFERIDSLNYFSLPSTSPANAAAGIDILCQKWGAMFGSQK